MDSFCVFNDTLTIGSFCSQLPLSLNLDLFHHLRYLAGGCGNSFDHANFLAVLPCVHARAATLQAWGFSLSFPSYHLSHVANWQKGRRLGESLSARCSLASITFLTKVCAAALGELKGSLETGREISRRMARLPTAPFVPCYYS